jgi:hypothetical protein
MRRGVSTLYYGLFHRLTSEAAAAFKHGGAPLITQAARAFSHTTMRKVCDIYAKSKTRRLPAPLDKVTSEIPDPRLVQVADIFVSLQEARHSADYDMAATIDRAEVVTLLEMAEYAQWKLDEICPLPETTVFLTALLLFDRWPKRA